PAGFTGFAPHTPMSMAGMMRGMSMSGPMTMTAPPWLQGAGGLRSLQAAVRLSDGMWLSFATALPNAAPPTQWPFFAATATMAVIVVLASAWAVGRVTAPLRLLAQAAERLGRDVNAPPILEAGTREMRQATQSFNQMQARIRRLVDNRTRMLAALSHDLRTPLTLLRLRTEGLPESEDRDRMLATIGELDTMIGASLSFARDQAVAEAKRRTDVGALLTSIVDDMADAGLPVTVASAESVVLDCQPVSLRRALTNLIDNAVKYGGSAHVAIAATASSVTITIDDSGPGIPEAELQKVFEPFHRLEESRSRETGGTGLGLSIAQSIVQAHGGDIVLANRPEGGLRASIFLPR
ncbi:MAG TPA: ATP-binding protein, partial [Acetobacteraceae bacterium]|nr:ATP-binding protein [Acetobacteraceae bacterium]